MDQTKELYTILGVDQGASDAQIRSAYERLVAENPEGTPLHDSIVQAYTILSDMDSRALYDVTGKVSHKRKRSHTKDRSDRLEKTRYALNTLFLAGAVVTTIFFILQWSGSLGTAPFYWACGVSLFIKILEYILRLFP